VLRYLEIWFNSGLTYTSKNPLVPFFAGYMYSTIPNLSDLWWSYLKYHSHLNSRTEEEEPNNGTRKKGSTDAMQSISFRLARGQG